MANHVRDQVFISYSHDDKKWLELLLKHLSPLIRAKPNAIWWDGFIEAGQKWREVIDKALETANVAVLLVSPNFLSSQFIIKEELPTILDAAEGEGVRVLWCMVRKCWYEETRLVDYQGAHDPKKAWNTLTEGELDALLVDVAKKIKKFQESEPGPRARVEPPRTPAAEPTAAAETATPAPPRRVTEAPQAGARDETGHSSAERLLSGVNDLRVVDEIGNLFVLRNRWPDAEFTYDCMIELAAPYKERWMAQGYEKLGVVRQRQNRLIHAA